MPVRCWAAVMATELATAIVVSIALLIASPAPEPPAGVDGVLRGSGGGGGGGPVVVVVAAVVLVGMVD